MLPYIHIPTDIILDKELNNVQKNILILLYQYKDKNNECSLTQDEIAELLSKYKQLIYLNLKNAKIAKYIDKVSYTGGKVGGKRNAYKLKLIPSKNNNIKFEQVNANIYKQFRYDSDVIINYLKLKNAWFFLKNNENADDDDYCIHCNWKLAEYDEITRRLKTLGLLNRKRVFEFPLEDIKDEIINIEDKIKEEPIKKSEHEDKYMKLIKQYIKVTNKPVNYDKALIHFKKAEEVGKTYDDIKAIVKYLAENNEPIYFLNTTTINKAGTDIQQLLKRIEDAEVNKDKPARFVKYFYQLKDKEIPTTSIKSNLELAEKLINTYKLGNKKIKNFLGFEKPEISLFVEYCANTVDVFNYLKNEQTTDKIYEQLMCLDNHYVSNWSRKEIDEYIKSIKEGN